MMSTIMNIKNICVSLLLDAMDSSYQAISSGLLQEDGPGIKDPCEREQVRNADLLSFILRFGVCCTTLMVSVSFSTIEQIGNSEVIQFSGGQYPDQWHPETIVSIGCLD